jgi:hypothetical protein
VTLGILCVASLTLLGLNAGTLLDAIQGMFGTPSGTLSSSGKPSPLQARPVASAPLQATPKLLAWKLQASRPIYVEITTESRQTTTMGGKPTTDSLKQTCLYRWNPEQHEGGKWSIRKTIEQCRLEMRSGIRSLQFDTSRKEEPDALLARALVGVPIYLTLDRDWNLLDVTGTTELVANLADVEPSLRSVFAASFQRAALQHLVEGFFQAVPGKGVGLGETWVRERSMPALLGGRYDARYTYTYEGTEGALERIKVGTRVMFHPSGNDPEPGVSIREADLKPELFGSLLFDARKGRLALGEMRFLLGGRMRLEIGGQATTAEIASVKATTVKVSDENLNEKP